MHHDLLHLLHTLGRADPELPLRLFKALRLDLLDLGDRIVSLLSPLKLFVQKIEHGKVKTPHIVASRQINTHVRVQRSKGDSSAEICTLPLWYRHVIAVQMFLGKAEIDYEDLTIFLAHYEIRGFHVSVNETSLVDFSD